MKNNYLLIIALLLQLCFSINTSAQQSNSKEDYTAYLPEVRGFNKMLSQSPQTGTILTKEGLQNSILALDPQGNLLSARAKKFLFPGGELAFLGFHVPHRKPYIPGEIPPYIELNGIKVTALLCFEELDHSLAIEGAKMGSQLLTVSAIEETMGDTIEVQNQFIGVGVFLAVETGLPVVRSSFVGPAAIIAPDGRVLAFSNSLTNGILTLE